MEKDRQDAQQKKRRAHVTRGGRRRWRGPARSAPPQAPVRPRPPRLPVGEGPPRHHALPRRQWPGPKESPWSFPWTTTWWAGSPCSTPVGGLKESPQSFPPAGEFFYYFFLFLNGVHVSDLNVMYGRSLASWRLCRRLHLPARWSRRWERRVTRGH
jgi:hypothetical protein